VGDILKDTANVVEDAGKAVGNVEQGATNIIGVSLQISYRFVQNMLRLLFSFPALAVA
jgi:hypothetical protein